MKISFKAARMSDIETVVGFMRELFESDNPPPGKFFDRQQAVTAVANLLAKPLFGRIWLMLDHNRPFGYIVLTLGYTLEYHGCDAFVDELYMQEPYRGRGIGTKALALVEETCRELGVNALHLEVERPNVMAQNFYRKNGFEDHDRYLMTKWLTNRS